MAHEAVSTPDHLGLPVGEARKLRIEVLPVFADILIENDGLKSAGFQVAAEWLAVDAACFYQQSVNERLDCDWSVRLQ
jgi:hypothetical protein